MPGLRRIFCVAALVSAGAAAPIDGQVPRLNLGGIVGWASVGFSTSTGDDSGSGYYVGAEGRFSLTDPNVFVGQRRLGVRVLARFTHLDIANFDVGGSIKYQQLMAGLELVIGRGRLGSFYTIGGVALHAGSDCATCESVSVGGVWGIGHHFSSDGGRSFDVHADFDFGGARTILGDSRVVSRLGIGFGLPVGS